MRGLADHARARLPGRLRRHALGPAARAAPATARAASAATCRRLARAAVAFGVDALFMEMHEDPDRTLPDGRPLSDGPNMLRIDDLPRLLEQLRAIRAGLGEP